MTKIKSFYFNSALVADAIITFLVLTLFNHSGPISLALNAVLGAGFVYLYYWMQANQSSILERLNLGSGTFSRIVSILGVYCALYLLLFVVQLVVPLVSLVVFPMGFAMIVAAVGSMIRRSR